MEAHPPCGPVYRRIATDSGSIACSGKSSSVPQRVQIASWSFTTRPQPGHWRRSSSRSLRYSSAASSPPIGTIAEIRNQRTNEEPLTLPTIPPDRPKKKQMTRYATRSNALDRPDHRDGEREQHGRPQERGDDA